MEDRSIIIRIEPAGLLLPGLGLISAIFLAVAAFGPWATTIGVTSVSGMHDNGVLILPLAVIAGIGAIAYMEWALAPDVADERSEARA